MRSSALFGASNFSNFFRGSGKSQELSDTRALYARAKALHERSPLGKEDGPEFFVLDVVTESCDRAGITPSTALGEALFSAAERLLGEEGIFPLRDLEYFESLGLEEGVRARAYLTRKIRFLENFDRLSDIAREKIIRIFEGMLGYLPSAVIDADEVAESGTIPLQASLIDLCDKPREIVERICLTMNDADVTDARLFQTLQDQLERRLAAASGIRWEDRLQTRKQPIFPTESRIKADADVVRAYLGGTPFASIFDAPFPFHIPFPVRFEHMHIVGGTGHGKTQLLQTLIYDDLLKSKEDGRSVVVMDSQGDLFRTISRLALFSPVEAYSLIDRLVIIDPTDVEYPACLNMFDFDRGRLAKQSPLDREKLLNGTIELYEYFFGALLGAELTQKQGVIFKYLARLMLEIPEATVHTFRELMENGHKFRPYMEKLPPSARSFFLTRFFDRGFNETKKQILTRLWGVLSNATFERMFSHPRNKVDIYSAMQEGKIILINTAKDLLQQDGSAIFGRFFIALIAQSALQRASLPPHERRPTFVYIDEAADYFDDKIGALLNQARKYKVGMVLAHQNLDQLSTSLRASIFASTSIKLAGGVSAKDASLFASEMDCEADFIHGMKKGKGKTAFACYVRNLTPHAIKVDVPLGVVEKQPQLSQDDFEMVMWGNRDAYCVPFDQMPALPAPELVPEEAPREPATKAAIPIEEEVPPAKPAPPPASPAPIAREPAAAPVSEPAPAPPVETPKSRLPVPAPLGRGGRQHKYLQQLFKGIAEERGFRAVIEEPILDGAGRVDLALTRGELRIACEVSVTTGKDHELGNVEKCLAAGYAHVVLVSAEQRYLTAMQKYVAQNLSEGDGARVRCLVPDAFVAFLDELGVPAPAPEVIRGYKVKVTREVVSAEEAAARRAEIAKVIARSMRSPKTEDNR